ncbi:MAG: hypothetical protein GY715_20085 [Planctomycetes bacterium]|nr:hypothetical protein [Planctomycetota bacterium]
MNAPAPNDRPLDPELLPEPETVGAADTRAEAIAGAQLVHGLLDHLRHDDDDTQRARIASVMTTIEGEAKPIVLRRRFRMPAWPVASGLAAALLLVITVLVVLPTQRTALAVVRTSIEAARTASDRSYEVRVTRPGAEVVSEEATARIDLRDDDHMLIVARSPFGHRVVVGRDPHGAWAIRHDGTIDVYPPAHTRPRWIDFGQSTFLIDSVDSLLVALPDTYRLRLHAPAPLPDGGAAVYERVSAVREPRPSPDPRRIELWVDSATGLVERMELHWPRRPERGEGPRRGPGMREHPRPPRPHDGPPGPRPPRRGPGRPPHGPPPAFIDGRPDFDGDRHAPPPRMIVFERIDTEPFADDWFEPETHADE